MIDELYAASPVDFVRLRTARVAEARKAGDRPLAKQIGELRRPTKAAWVVNLLSRDAPDDLAELLELGAALAEAQRTLSAPDLRRLSSQRNAAVNALARRAEASAAERGQKITEAVRIEAQQTLQAALADPEVAAQVTRGCLIQAVQYGGFGPGIVAGPALAVVPASPKSEAEPRADDQDQDPKLTAKIGEATVELAQAESALGAARRNAAVARKNGLAKQTRVEELRTVAAELRRQLTEAEQRLLAAEAASEAAAAELQAEIDTEEQLAEVVERAQAALASLNAR